MEYLLKEISKKNLKLVEIKRYEFIEGGVINNKEVEFDTKG